MPEINVANVACGFHGSDFNHMRKTVRLAKQHGVKVGAHPSLPDLQGFGRREMKIGREELTNCLLYQIGALDAFARLAGRVGPDAVLASTSSTISPSHLADAVEGPERFLVAHWLNPAHIVPLVEVVPGARTAEGTVKRTLALLERLGKVPVRCNDSPGFIW